MSEVSGALERAARAIGDRWSLLLVAALMERPLRFGEIQAAIPGLAPNILTARLRHLERQGLVVGRPYSRRPVRLDYHLTGRGTELADAIRMLAAWEASGSAPDPDGTHAAEEGHPRHRTCGTSMELRWWCPTCAHGVTSAEGTNTEGEDYWL